VAELDLVRSMTRCGISGVLLLTLASCASLQPQPYHVEAKPKDIRQADIDSIVAAAQRYLYGYPIFSPRRPIHRVSFEPFQGSTEVKVWYGSPKPGERECLIYARQEGRWQLVGSGVDLPPRKT
jgi:hypothetical protein